MIDAELSARSLMIRLFFCFFDGSFKSWGSRQELKEIVFQVFM